MSNSFKRNPILSLLFFSFLFCFPGKASTQELKQYSAAIHVHSTFSNGEHEVLELARFAKERNIDVLILTDSFLTSVTYGIWPFDRIGIRGINKSIPLNNRTKGTSIKVHRFSVLSQVSFPMTGRFSICCSVSPRTRKWWSKA